LTTKKLQFFFRSFPQFSTLMEIPEGNTMENSGKWNPKKGFKSPTERRGEIQQATRDHTIDRFPYRRHLRSERACSVSAMTDMAQSSNNRLILTPRKELP
jgi:hypothetical protein